MCVLILVAAVSAPFAGLARADVLDLIDKGEIEGTLEELEFRTRGGEDAAYSRDEILTMRRSRGNQYKIRFKDGTSVDGALVSLTFNSVGGRLKFSSEDVAKLKITEDPLAEVKKELAEKKAQVAEHDAAGLLTLAKWCRKKGLSTEATELARACLDAEPNAKTSEEAHKFLGHVLVDGEWLTPAEATEQKDEDEGVPSATPSPEDNGGPTTDELKQSFAENETLNDKYKAMIDAEKQTELDALKAKYGQRYEGIELRIKRLVDEIKEREDLREREREIHRKELQDMRVPKNEIERRLRAIFDDFNSSYMKTVRALREQLMSAKLDRSQLFKIIKPARAKILRDTLDKEGRVKLAYLKVKRLLMTGKLVSTEQMAALYEDVLKD